MMLKYYIKVYITNINYTYEVLENDIQGLKARCLFIEMGVAGQSVLLNIVHPNVKRQPFSINICYFIMFI